MRGSAFFNKHHNACRDPSEDERCGEEVNWRPRPEWELYNHGRRLRPEVMAVLEVLDCLQLPLAPQIVMARRQWCEERGLPCAPH